MNVHDVLISFAALLVPFGQNLGSRRCATQLPRPRPLPPPPPPPPPAVNGAVRIAISQLDASSSSLNGSASWVVDSFASRVRHAGGQWAGGLQPRGALDSPLVQCGAGPAHGGWAGNPHKPSPTHQSPPQHDVASALLATDFIPCFSGPTTYTIFRNQPVIDGGGLWVLEILGFRGLKH